MPEQKFFTSKDARALIGTFGLSIFPVHGVAGGVCTCGDLNCTNPGKHPATNDGFKSASNDVDQVLRVWDGRKNLNVGVATGLPSSIFVIDIDGPEGEENLKSLGEIPSTLVSMTGKGRHLFFNYPGEPVITKRGILEKIDVRGDGGYIVGPGSNHISGARYDWHNPFHPIADAPDAILNLVVKSRIITPKSSEISLYQPSGSIFRNNEKLPLVVVEAMLNCIDPDIGYDEWISIGMAIHSDGLPFSVWDNWSRGGSKYDSNSMGAHWKSFNSGGSVTIGTLVHYAKLGGWLPASASRFFSAKPTIHPIAHDPEREETGREITDEDGVIHTLDPDMFYIKAGDIHASIDASDFIQGMMTDGALSVVYGESNCGKTFFMSDLAFHVAIGKRWRDKRVEAGGVVYVALEGSHGLKNRISAFKKENPGQLVNFVMVPCPVDFMDPEGNINKFIDMLRIARADLGSVRLVVIDTLARAMTGGDENSGKDMSILVHHADRIRYETGAHVCFIHHSGKDKAKGARGHSSLRAAVDTEIEISRDPEASYSKVRIVKQREMEMLKDMAFSLKFVELGFNRHNEVVSSCVVETYSEENLQSKKSRLKPITQKSLAALATLIYETGQKNYSNNLPANVKIVSQEAFKNMLVDRGILSDEAESNRSQFSRIKRELLENQRAVFKDGNVWISDDTGTGN